MPVMDWNTKWGWENLVNPTIAKNISKQQTIDREFEEGIISKGPFCIDEGKNNSSGSELAPGSSARSSKSVCTDSSFKEKNTLLAFGNMNAFSGEIGEQDDLGRDEHNESPSPLESSVGSGESLIGLKLGKRMYFENNGLGGNVKTVSVPEVPVSSIASNVKKIKSPDRNSPRCQVDGCNLDLSTVKEYHRKHKVCASHSICSKVVIGGLERRFCQQCSRFHNLSEFDEKKRSCRKRLSDHNARRRKPQLDPMTRLPSPFSAFTRTDGRPQMSYLPSNVSHVYSRSSSNSTWVSSFSSKYTTKNGCMLNFGETGGLDEQLQLTGTQLPHASSLPGHGFNRLLPSKGTKSDTSTRGFKESVLPPNSDSAPDFHRALSLLSNDSWSSFQSPIISLDHSISINRMHHLPSMQGFPQSFPLGSSEFCQTDNHSSNSFVAATNDNDHFQPFKAPYENVIFSNLFN